MDPEELQARFPDALILECAVCRSPMPFQLIEIPGIGEGAICMNCETPTPETEEAMAEYEQMLAEDEDAEDDDTEDEEE